MPPLPAVLRVGKRYLVLRLTADVLPLPSMLEVIIELLAFMERAQSCWLHGRNVNEYIL